MVILIIIMPFTKMTYGDDEMSVKPSPVNLVSKREWSKEERISLGYVPDEIIVKFKEDKINLKTTRDREFVESFFDNNKVSIASGIINKLSESERVSNEEVQSINLQEFGENFMNIDEHLKFANITVLKLSVDDVVYETAEELANFPDIEYAEPNFIITPLYSPNEGSYTDHQLWGLDNDGSTTIIQGDADNSPAYGTNNPGGTGGLDIHADEAWDKLTENEEVRIVAVLDTGVDYDHEDLDDVMWSPSGTCYDEENSAIGGGCPNHGWNYSGDGDEDDPVDVFGHGTYVSGIIAAEHSDDDQGILGVAKNVKIMAVKTLDDDGDIVEEVKGIEFAQNNGAHIINASYGSGLTGSSAEEEAIEDFADAGGIFVVAAGNSSDDIDSLLSQYPVGYDLDGADFDNLIGVAALDQAYEARSDTNYGATSVDLGAPGANILSTWPSDGYEFHGQTSAAAPFVSGTAALIWGYRPSLTAQQVKLAIMESGDAVSDLNPSTGSHPTVTGDAVNAHNAMLATEGALVVPTKHSISTSGNWNSTSTWLEGTVPTPSDVVEINGNIALNANPTISGLIVNSGKTLRSTAPGTYTLTLSGANADLKNNGTITDYSSGHISLSVQGNVENNGTISLLYMTMSGSTEQHLTTANSLTALTVNNDVTVSGDLDINSTLYVLSDKTLTLDSGNTVYVGGNLYNYGTITGGDLILDGGNQTITFGGTYNVDTFTVGGTYTKTLDDDLTINGNLIVNANLRAYGDRSIHYVTVSGNVSVNGGITEPGGYYYGWISLDVSGDYTNTGTAANHYTYVRSDLTNSGSMTGTVYAKWDEVEGADSYEFQYTNTSDEWQTEVSTATSTVYNITSFVNDDRRWRWRSIEDSTDQEFFSLNK